MMNKQITLLVNGHKMKSLYEKQFEETRQKYQINQFEIDTLAFLANNPGFNTAKDIVEIRMIAKSYVSTSVENLIKKGLLARVQDKNDRRIIRLQVTEKAIPVIADIRHGQDQTVNMLFAGMTDDEIKMFEVLLAKIFNNVEMASRNK